MCSQNPQINSAIIKTPLGNMLAISDDQHLHMLQFIVLAKGDLTIAHLPKMYADLGQPCPVEGDSAPIESIKQELSQYFIGTLRTFATPLKLDGTPFQQTVWSALRTIPYGTTISYAELAQKIGRPNAYRAVAQANGANRFCIIIPCHRVIASDGSLGGYSGGVEKKVGLNEHESVCSQ